LPTEIRREGLSVPQTSFSWKATLILPRGSSSLSSRPLPQRFVNTASLNCYQIVSGAVAERVSFESYLIYSVFLVAFVYPVGTHWTWSDNAWLANLGFKDFAGSTVVHVLGGSAAFAACYFLGPRLGRFNPDGTPNPNVRGHSSLLTALGGMLLWIGFLAFNGGSTLGCIHTDEVTMKHTSVANEIAKIFGVTIMSGCGGN
jgi:ammonia channel protein AmtB